MLLQEKNEGLLFELSVDKNDNITEVHFEWIKREDLSEMEILKYKEEAQISAEYRFYNNVQYREKKKIGRNEMCPCGSGKKYKKCHALN